MDAAGSLRKQGVVFSVRGSRLTVSEVVAGLGNSKVDLEASAGGAGGFDAGRCQASHVMLL